ncbi:hypothetical protein ACTMTI_24415 [Nonomuraea sp. H19]|uniref:hypothetical protein n=1 Tax=Nonomuraea sp. H19 TaxID=3452206 RepID=UPI003F8B9C14
MSRRWAITPAVAATAAVLMIAESPPAIAADNVVSKEATRATSAPGDLDHRTEVTYPAVHERPTCAVHVIAVVRHSDDKVFLRDMCPIDGALGAVRVQWKVGNTDYYRYCRTSHRSAIAYCAFDWPESASVMKSIIPAKWYPDNRPTNWVLHAAGVRHFR